MGGVLKRTCYLSTSAFANLLEAIPRVQNILEHIHDVGGPDAGFTEIALSSTRQVCGLFISFYMHTQCRGVMMKFLFVVYRYSA